MDEMDGSCIFCRIVLGEAKSFPVYSDDRCLAFLDIHPINKGHVLIVPKAHKARFHALTASEAGHLFEIAHKIYGAIRETRVRCEGANIFLSDGIVAGQEVHHAHLHVAPRFSGDGHRMGFSHSDPTSSNDMELGDISTKIRARIVP